MRRLRVKKRVEPHRNVTKRRPVGQTWTAFAALYLSKARTTTANKIIKNKNKIGGGRKGPALNPALQVAMLVRPRKEKKGGKTETVLVTKKFVFSFSFSLFVSARCGWCVSFDELGESEITVASRKPIFFFILFAEAKQRYGEKTTPASNHRIGRPEHRGQVEPERNGQMDWFQT